MNRPLARDPSRVLGPPHPAVLDALVVSRSRPRPYRCNVQAVLDHDPRLQGQLRHDTLAQRIEWRDRPGEDALPDLEVFFERVYDFRPKKVLLTEELLRVADPVHPVAAWLDRLEWDRTARLDDALGEVLHARPSPLLRVYSRRLFIGLVARARRPGCKLDTLPLFSGPQGIGKSSLVRALCPNPAWHASIRLDTHRKDGMQDLVGKWLIELAEMDDVKAASSGSVKAFLTRSTDRYRPSYGARSLDFPRTCAFVGTTNATELWEDPTEARRYWPIALDRPLDLAAVASIRDKLFAEADHRYRQDKPWWLDSDEAPVHEEEAREWRIEDSIEPLILKWVKRHGTGFDTSAVLAEVARIPRQRQRLPQRQRIGRVLKAMGFVKVRPQAEGKTRPWLYVWPAEKESWE